MPDTALVIIDMQTALVSGAHDEKGVLERVNRFITRARAAGVPVIFVQHSHATFAPMAKGEPGWQLDARLDQQASDLRIDKQACDAFDSTPLADELRALGVKTVILAGLQTEYCIDTSARAALGHGFDVVLMADCHTTGDDLLPAHQMIGYHNHILAQVVHPRHRIRVLTSREVQPDIPVRS